MSVDFSTRCRRITTHTEEIYYSARDFREPCQVLDLARSRKLSGQGSVSVAALDSLVIASLGSGKTHNNSQPGLVFPARAIRPACC
jgi:hypothetical protein